MSDDIERVIQRDLDRLPLLPADRWVPEKPGRSGRLALFTVRGVVVLAAIALAVTGAPLLEGLRAGSTEAPRAIASASPLSEVAVVTRQTVLARIRGLSGELSQVVRIEAKLVTLSAMRASPSAGRLFDARPAQADDAWIVAVSGEIKCNCASVPAGGLHSAVYWIDPRSGDVLSRLTGPDAWPPGFDSLPDERLAKNLLTVSGHLVAYSAPGTVIIQTTADAGRQPAGTQLTLRVDGDTAYAWGAGQGSVSALTLEELARGAPLVVGVSRVEAVFEDSPQADGSYRLQWLRSVGTR